MDEEFQPTIPSTLIFSGVRSEFREHEGIKVCTIRFKRSLSIPENSRIGLPYDENTSIALKHLVERTIEQYVGSWVLEAIKQGPPQATILDYIRRCIYKKYGYSEVRLSTFKSEVREISNAELEIIYFPDGENTELNSKNGALCISVSFIAFGLNMKTKVFRGFFYNIKEGVLVQFGSERLKVSDADKLKSKDQDLSVLQLYWREVLNRINSES